MAVDTVKKQVRKVKELDATMAEFEARDLQNQTSPKLLDTLEKAANRWRSANPNQGAAAAGWMNVDKELQKQARKSLRGVDPSIPRYMQTLEHEVCHLEKINRQLSQQIEELQQRLDG